MNTDDSFNDSDEMLSLYSSKSIKETFKAQLKKIVATSNSTRASKDQEKEEISCGRGKISKENIQKNFLNPPRRVTETNEDVSFSKVVEDCSLDNSIEIVEDVTVTPTRYSERLRKRTGNSCTAVRKPAADRRKLKSRRRKKKGKNSIEEITLDDSLDGLEDNEDDLNPEISVKVIWKSVNVKKFIIRKFQKLSCLYELLSKEEGLPEDKIVLKFNNIKVSPNDTPDSLNLQVYHFLDGGVINESSNFSLISESKTSESDANSVTIKFQDAHKKIIEVTMLKSEKLKIGMIKCSEQLNIPLKKIKFFIDGDPLNPSETPDTLGLENGEVIDIKVTN